MTDTGRFAGVKAHWTLDPEIAFVNHGSYGACPIEVLQEQDRWRRRMEREPVTFFARDLYKEINLARAEVAAFLHADLDGLVFVPNATTGVNTVLQSLDLRPGQEIVTTHHVYGAVANTIAKVCAATGAVYRLVHVAMPLPPDEQIIESVIGVVNDSTRLVVIDAVTSCTGALFPAEQIAAACATRGVPTLIDAAHAPGLIDVNLRESVAAYWTGNFHKWPCAPKGSAVLWVAPAHRERVRPLVTSWDDAFDDAFTLTGTYDPTPYLATPAAIRFFDAFGWDATRTHNNMLAEQGRQIVAAAAGTHRQVDAARQAAMSLIALPDPIASTDDAAAAFRDHLFRTYRVEAACNALDGRGYLRLSAQIYNTPDDYERVALALREEM